MNLMAAMAGFALTGSVALAQGTPTTKNLLVNGTFEKGTEGWTFDGHGKAFSEMAMDENEKHSNRASLRVTNTEGNDTHVKQKVTVEPNTKYRLEGYIKTKDVFTVKRDGKDGASIAVEGGFQRTVPVAKTSPWTKVTHEFATGEEKEIEIGTRLGFFSAPVTGTAWYADISLVKIGKAPPRR